MAGYERRAVPPGRCAAMIDVLAGRAGPAGLTRGGQPIRVCLLCTQGRRTDVLHERAHRYRHDPEARADGVVEDVVRRVVWGGVKEKGEFW